MFPASRWAARLSRQAPIIARRSITTKNRGIARKLPRTGLPQNHAQGRHIPQEEHGNSVNSPLHREKPDQKLNNDAQHNQPDRSDLIRTALQTSASNNENTLLAPVHIPSDPHSILPPEHPATSILSNSTIIIQRQIEMMNLLVGFEQANKYAILDPLGNHIGYLAEPEGNMLKRQMFKTHRGFTVHVFDRQEREVLRITRPFTWINSRVGVYDAFSAGNSYGSDGPSGLARTEDMRVIGEVQQQWAPLRRKYNLFLNRPPPEDAPEGTPQLTAGELPLSTSTALQTVDATHRPVNMAQWAYCDEPFLSWDFSLLSEDRRLLGSVNRNFAGFAREIFTDTGVYALRMDAAALAAEPAHIISRTGEGEVDVPGMTLDQRAVMLATAVSVDFDYFSRHSGSGGMLPVPMWMPWWGGGAAEAGAAGGAAEAGAAGGAVGAAEGVGGLGAEVGAAARGGGALGAGEGAVAGAGSMAGYEAMQRGFGRGGDDASPTTQDPYSPQAPQDGSAQQGEESFWGEKSPWEQEGQSPWRQDGGDQSPWGDGGGASGGGGGDGGGGFSWTDFFGGD